MLDIVIVGLSLSSSWGNGHATTYRALVKALHRRGHRVTFLERDVPWYREHRDLTQSPHCDLHFYASLPELMSRHAARISTADLVVLGSYVPDGIAVADWVVATARGVTAFYDIDTPVTLAALAAGTCEYLRPALVPLFDLYLSFAGGPALQQIEELYGSPRARVLYCSVDADLHRASELQPVHALGYLGTYSADRQPALNELLLAPARAAPEQRFVVGGPSYPSDILWPDNVEREEHVPPERHAAFYGTQRFTLNVTRKDMVACGFSPSVRLFEAASCGVPVISDRWAGLETIFRPQQEILIADSALDVVRMLRDIPDERRRAIAAAARARVLKSHTADHRAQQLEAYYAEVEDSPTKTPRRAAPGAIQIAS